MVTTAEFFAEIFRGCGGWLEIRLLPPERGGARSEFFPLPSGAPEAAAFAAGQSGKNHVFFSVYPRSRERGRDASAVRQVQLLYADLDAGHFAKGVEEIDARLVAFRPAPSVVVASGGGRHAYWLLDTPVGAPPGDAHRQVQDCLWGIADALGVPRQQNTVHDLARVLRVPGTANIKPGYGPGGAPCEVLLWEAARRYPPSAFREFAIRGRSRPGRAAESGAAGQGEGPDAEAVLARLQPSPAILELIRHGAPPGQRSEADQKVITHLLARGATREEIRAIFRNPAWRIGDKYREKGRDGDRYLFHSIKNAEAWLSQHEQNLTVGDFNWAGSMALKMLPKDLQAALLRPPTDPDRAVSQLALAVQEWANRGARPSAIQLALAYYAGHLPLRILRSALERGMPKNAAEQRANPG